jgi:hypothetical protein
MTTTGFGRLIPFLTVIVVAFATLQVYTALMYGLSSQFAFAALYGVLALAGFALARALWINRHKLTSRR